MGGGWSTLCTLLARQANSKPPPPRASAHTGGEGVRRFRKRPQRLRPQAGAGGAGRGDVPGLGVLRSLAEVPAWGRGRTQ